MALNIFKKRPRKPVKKLNEKEMDLGYLLMYRYLIVIFIAIAVILLIVGYNKDMKFLMFVSTVPVCVAIYYYLNYNMMRDRIVEKLLHQKGYAKDDAGEKTADKEALTDGPSEEAKDNQDTKEDQESAAEEA